MKSFLCLFFYLVLINCSFGQDIHFSQFYASPYNLNPALTGAFDGNYRFTANYRTQWRSVTVPYVTTGFFADLRNAGVKDLHAGVSIYHDKAGDSGFSTFKMAVSGAYSKSLNVESTKHLIAGIQVGFSQRNINFNNLSFDNQFNGERYDASLGTGETFTRQSYLFLNLNAGLAYDQKVSEKFSFITGIGVFNLTTPDQTFFNETVSLDRRFTLYGKGSYLFNENLTILPSVLMMFQGPHSEYLTGGAVKREIENLPGRYRAVYAGTWFRLKDAGYVMLGMDYNNWNVGVSYDLNYSALVPASNYRGGLEVSAIYIIRIPPFRKVKYKACPAFI